MECLMRRLLLFMLVLAVFIPLGVSAQETITIEMLEVEFWPEYDQPEMLVIYHIELSPDTQFPATLSIRIPTAAGEPYVVAVEDIGETDYQRRVEGEWSAITFVSPGPNIQLEYYDPGLTKDEDQRSFTYTWPGNFTVNSFQVIAQVPFDAFSFETTPVLSEEVAGVNGLSYRQSAFGGLSVGDQPSITLEYQKSSGILSIEKQGTADTVDEIPSSTGSGADNDWLVILLATAGVGIIGYGVYSYTQSTSKRRNAGSSRRARRPADRVKGEVFCHQCGTQAYKGDKFCRECGQKLRT
jgi:hypothetical protein